MRIYTYSALGDGQAVADAADGEDPLGLAGIPFQFFADLPNVDINKAFIGLVPPDSGDQFGSSPHPSWVLGHGIEEVKFEGGEGNQGSLALDLALASIEAEGSQMEGWWRGGWGRVALTFEDSLDAGSDFREVKGLGQVVIGSLIEAFELITRGDAGGEDEDANLRKMALNVVTEFVATDVRQV
jgi:hypothetical protein